MTWRFNKEHHGEQHFGTVVGHPEGGGVTVRWDHPHPVWGGVNETAFRCGEVREARPNEEAANAEHARQRVAA